MKKDIRYDFDVMHKNQKIASVRFHNGELQVERFVSGLLQVFPRENTDNEDIYSFLESRCYENGRPDLKEILAVAGMESNNPWQWCEKTHGIRHADYYWIKKPTEDVCWEDVKIRD